ncbi:MAG: hypothetical protein AAF383_21220 [Cyanobacteria bacterium P01_A01_bin.83]
MTDQQLEKLPVELTKRLLKYGQQILMAAYDAISKNAIDENNATKIA